MSTVRLRTTVLSTVVAGVVLVVAALLLLTTLRTQLTEQSDGALRIRATELARQAADGASDPLAANPVTDDGLVQVVDRDGAVLTASPNLAGAGPINSPSTSSEPLRAEALTAPDDQEVERYRVWRLSTETPDGVVTVFVGTSLESVDEATGTLRGVLVVGLPLMLLLLAAGTWVVVGRTLGRVERVRSEVAGIDEEDLSRRLEPGPPDEIGRLVSTMNAMLHRLEDGQGRQRTFVADASHELQSPLTAFRTQLEVARAHPDPDQWPRLVDDLLDDTDRLQRLVGDLLLLEVSGSTSPARTRLALREVVGAGIAGTPPGPIAARLLPGADPVVLGDESQLTRVVRNLLENALRHARTRVTVTVEVTPDAVLVRVADDGPGVPPEHAGRIFDRFSQLDAARSRSSSGAGLGLAIARAVARGHGGDVVLAGGPPGATFELRLPR